MGFFSGVGYLNEKLFSFTGRRGPSSLSEIKGNLGNNVNACARLCTAFLNSSVGLATAMGVLGLVTASVCAGEDLVDILPTTLLTTTVATSTIGASPGSAEESFLCFLKAPIPTVSGLHYSRWTPNSYDICGKPLIEIDCESILNNTMSQLKVPLLEPECVNVGTYQYQRHSDHSYPNNDPEEVKLEHWTEVYQIEHIRLKALMMGAQCLTQAFFYMVNNTLGQSVNLADMRLGVCKSGKQDSSIYQGDGRDEFCFEQGHHIQYYHLDKYESPDKCGEVIPSRLPPVIPMSMSDFVGDNSSNSSELCAAMEVAFGVGSAAIFLMTTIKVLLNQDRSLGFTHPRVSCAGLKKTTIALLKNSPLLLASGLGVKLLVSSVESSCAPLCPDGQHEIYVVTGLYGATAACKILASCLAKLAERRFRHKESGKRALEDSVFEALISAEDEEEDEVLDLHRFQSVNV